MVHRAIPARARTEVRRRPAPSRSAIPRHPSLTGHGTCRRSPVPPTFFVCYRREDAGYAAALTHALAQRHGRDRVFKDITSLPMGRDWHSEVVAAIGRSTHVLALVGPSWMAGVDPHGVRNGQLDPIVFELTEATAGGTASSCRSCSAANGCRRRTTCRTRCTACPTSTRPTSATESADTDVTMLVDRLSEPYSGRSGRHRTKRRHATPTTVGAGRVVGRLVALAVVGALALVGVTLWDKLPGLDTRVGRRRPTGAVRHTGRTWTVRHTSTNRCRPSNATSRPPPKRVPHTQPHAGNDEDPGDGHRDRLHAG